MQQPGTCEWDDALQKTLSFWDTPVSASRRNLVWGGRPAVSGWQEGMGSKDKAESQARVLRLMAEIEFKSRLSDSCPVLPVLQTVLRHQEALWMGPMGLHCSSLAVASLRPSCWLPWSLPFHNWQYICSSHTARGLLVGRKLIFPQRPFCLLGTAQITSLGFCTLFSCFAKMCCPCQLVGFC